MGPLLLALFVPRLVQDSIDLHLASRYFQEAKNASDDVCALWSKPLYGPMIFLDPASRFAVANGPDREGQLIRRGDLWIGKMPPEIGAANTARDWGGVHWTMVMWPLPSTTAERNMLLMHECWHRIQDEIGLPGESKANAHLDKKDGRIWLRLEWRALSRGLTSWGPERVESLTDALTFRAYRRAIFPTAAVEEDRMEVHEGMAEYSGVRSMGLGGFARRSYLSGRLKVNALKPSYSYAFAYETGPAYGLLLDMDSKDWRTRLTPRSSLSDMLRSVAKIEFPHDIAKAARARAGFYGGKEIVREEEARQRETDAKLKLYRRLLVDGPVLELPAPKLDYTFDPNEVVPFGELGTVYPHLTLSDEWGILEASKGARLVVSARTAYVSAPTSSDAASGDGWKLTLKPGWRVVPGSRKGDYRLERRPGS
ncbi:hypothetical protein [Fimbriimonas ginsengisoli]|uniref:Uncharacterized protein n=1 Tax=Fimbriimonas ginsengisoli Gsoil 348 TaxID=661478 RepID=A0A068NPT4_FIMGI|nr:hypothetical protein [Fimbriimonas ginsengisoli]AIE85392.1 hypothetical protein OP10G_2024 [Fimbriimonas ginsengisoli Gsoil 348]